ncbi:ABC transporter permease [Paenibacillus timonensis]|uniref:ABC transporter permease n=2 Tax=Paenibacillus timonensis TaxID=225915 RepID=A0ABW3SH44_9BACL|nr:ABC transporter permease [Paenibacillus timonensis]MCH1642078.1 ABC transporter permease [Paenibacillus timonensis]
MAASKRIGVATIVHRSLKANLPRNAMIVSAIVLTTLLLTSVFTMAFSINESMQLTKMKTAGGDYHGSFKYLTPAEAEKLRQHPLIKEYGQSVLVGRATSDVFRGTALEVDQIDEKEAKHSFIRFEEGSLPTEGKGIATSTWVLDLLGVPHELGAKVKLDLDIDGKAVTEEFVLAGYFPADRNLSMAGMAFVSEAFVQQHLSRLDPEQARKTGSYVNTIRLDVMFDHSLGIEKKLQKVLSDTGIDAPYGVNWAYSSVGLEEDPTSVAAFLVLILIIMVSGYLLIYNIFHISVVRDIKFYGLLKTIGTTPRQLKRVVSKQANFLYLVGLPIGLALGYGTGVWLMPLIGGFSSEATEETVSSGNPLIFIAAALFAYLTVRIAASKPGRTASRISPVEAVKYSGLAGNEGRGLGRKVKRSSQGAKLTRMAFANLFRSKKKLLLMLASLSLSLILFSVIHTVISSFSVNKYLNSFITGDFVIKEEVGGRGDVPAPDKAALTEEFARKLSQIDGVRSADKVYYRMASLPLNEKIQRIIEPLSKTESPEESPMAWILKNKAVDLQLHGLDPGWYGVIEPKDIVAGTFDRNKFASGDYVLVSEALLGSDHYARYYQPGDRIQFDGIHKSYEVMAVFSSDALYAAGTQYYTVGGFKVFWPADEFVKSVKDPILLSVTLHVDPAKLGEAESAVKSFTASSPSLIVKSREDYKEEMQGFIRVFQTIGYGLSLVIGLIGILNYVNTVITGMWSRRGEFAILESVGMTRKQLKSMLVLEGLYSVLLTGLIVSTVGMGLTYGVAKGIANGMAFTDFRMSPLPMAGMLALLLGMAMIVTLSSYRRMSQATIVERLREAE